MSRANGYLLMGPTILINDISQVNYYLQHFHIDVLGNWEATFYVETWDHFGLDFKDPNNVIRLSVDNVFRWDIKYQNLHSGFAAWWILQHRKAYKPFKTKLRMVVKLKGLINP